MTEQDIRKVRAELLLKGYNQARIARDLNLTKAHVGYVIKGLRESERVWRHVIEIVGHDPRPANLQPQPQPQQISA